MAQSYRLTWFSSDRGVVEVTNISKDLFENARPFMVGIFCWLIVLDQEENMAKSVAIVDDHETIVMFLSLLMRRLGFSVLPARSGAELFEKLDCHCPDLVITDYLMPEMDGLTVLKTLKEDARYAQIPVLLMSAHTNDDIADKCAEAGGVGFLTKPIQVASLNRMLQQCVTYPNNQHRNNLRCSYNHQVKVWQHGVQQRYRASTLSEGGMFLCTNAPLPVGTRLGIDLDIKSGRPFFTHGTVIYQRGALDDQLALEPGMALRFDKLPENDTACLKEYLIGLLIKDAPEAALVAESGASPAAHDSQLQKGLSDVKREWRGQESALLS